MSHLLNSISCRVTADEHGQDLQSALLLNGLHDLSHLVQFFGADVRTVGKAKVDEAEAPLEILVRDSPRLHLLLLRRCLTEGFVQSFVGVFTLIGAVIGMFFIRSLLPDLVIHTLFSIRTPICSSSI